MSIPMTDRLAGNPEAIASRERYREIVKALGEVNGAFVARFEVKLGGDGSCVLLATSSLGQDCDEDLCKLAIAMLGALTGVKVDQAAESSRKAGEP